MGIETFLLIAIIVLVVLAVGDIIVGVSNDAVNFLNSAIGSQVASFRTIMTVASVGIFVGALSSAGMMEIARKGIINPDYFSLYEVVIIFVAVMITDVILLDFFNTIGIPTSTTVSLVFEMLGAAFIISAYKVIQNNEPLNYLLNSDMKSYLNWDKTTEIIFSIFISVLIAFIIGAVVQYISRILFTFNYQRNMKVVGVIWAALAVTSMSYYLVYKGLKSSYSSVEVTKSEMKYYLDNINSDVYKVDRANENTVAITKEDKTTVYELKPSKKDKNEMVYATFYGSKKIKEFVDYVKSNILPVLGGLLLFWIIVFSILNSLKINILRLVIFAGTFCMAMAFAGNDLINFIGIPVTAIQSMEIYDLMGGQNPETFSMIGLKFPMQTPYTFLVIAGILMTATLWFSKKARNVTETELKLASQGEGEERFAANKLSKGIVKTSIFINEKIGVLIPTSLNNRIKSRFIPLVDAKEDVHFDLVRASANLTIASILIAIGTDLKLPLSTTYVTFMVAMGTSLADRAWGRETAVYRIAGVINVISSWFLTGLGAFVGGGITALIIISFGIYGLLFMIAVVVFIIAKTSIQNKNKIKEREESKAKIEEVSFIKADVINKSSVQISDTIFDISTVYDLSLNGLLNEDLNLLNKSKKILKDLKGTYSNTRSNVFKILKKSKYQKDKSAQIYIVLNDIMTDNIQSLDLLVHPIILHVENSHKPLIVPQIEITKELEELMHHYFKELKHIVSSQEFETTEAITELKDKILTIVESAIDLQADGISEKKFGYKNSNLMFAILLETKNVVNISYKFIDTFKRISEEKSVITTS
ncbi:MAG: inorganic phosphate transporter [Flavobacteriales bacterium]|nr:inorganic phosphate transporter [Flavobacteriales bacterium]